MYLEIKLCRNKCFDIFDEISKIEKCPRRILIFDRYKKKKQLKLRKMERNVKNGFEH